MTDGPSRLLRVPRRTRGKSRKSQVSAVRPARHFNYEETQRVRAGWLLVFFVIGFLALGWRVVDLTVVQHEDLVKQAKCRRMANLKLTKPRGEILDRDGKRLAGAINADSVFADPSQIKNPEEVAGPLAALLDLDRARVLKKLKTKGKYASIKRKISPHTSDVFDALQAFVRIAELNPLPGIHRVKETKRTYPRGKLAAQVLGFTNSDIVGLEGLEHKYENQLAGEAGRMLATKDALGNLYLTQGVQIVGREPGLNLKLTLNSAVQWFAEDALDDIVKKWRPAGAWAIVMDVRTGEILAIANRPTFDPARTKKYDPAACRNRAVLDMYEPGSTFKPLTIAAGLETGVISLDETLDCLSGEFVFGGHTIHDTHGVGKCTPAMIVKESSNIGSAKVGIRLGKKRIWEWLTSFGVGHRTGVDLPAESKGILRHFSTWYPVDMATHSYGQGVSVTALQLITAISTLGNGGRLMRPYLVSEIIDADGNAVHQTLPHIVRRVISEKTAKSVLDMMGLVTEEGGTGTAAAIEGVPVAGKTGTAYKVDPRTGRYHPTKRIGSFVGLVPGDKPRLAIVVVVDEPIGRGFGGIVAAPAFKEIASRSLDHLGLFSARGETEQELAAAIARNMDETAATPEVSNKTADQRNFGDGRAPDLIGLTKRDVWRLVDGFAVKLAMEGSGIVIEQSPRPGVRLGTDNRVRLQFASKR
jgi:cell division protein FtsI (penicillin-binding protein 3)